MKKNLFLLSAFCIGCMMTARAAVVNDSVNAIFQQAVVHEDVTVPVTFINDDTYPWTWDGTYIISQNKSVSGSKSEFSFTYTSDYQTQVQFYWKNFSSNYHGLQCFVDGVYYLDQSADAYKHFALPAGTHVITFRDSVSSTSGTYNRTSGVNAIRVREVRSFEEYLLTENSLPMTFQTDSIYPWTITSAPSAVCGNYNEKSTTSTLSATFTVDAPALFAFDSRAFYSTSSSTYNYNTPTYQCLSVFINGEEVWKIYNATSWTRNSTLLPAGTYQVEWKYWNSASVSGNAYIDNVSLTQSMTEVELEYAGTLGVEVLYKHNVLTDVQCLKVKGNLNSTDWATIKQMTNLRGLDLSEASFTSVPARQFEGRIFLNYIVLPEGLQTIEEYAFYDTYLWDIHIPSTVTSIGQYAFGKSNAPTFTMNVTFAENSQLQSLGAYCFSRSQLKRIKMPNSITSLGEWCFYYNTMMDSVILSDGITTLPVYSFSDCKNLSYIYLPNKLNSIKDNCFEYCKLKSIDLPESLRTIQAYAFRYCPLDSLFLPNKLSSLGSSAFANCTSLKYIELPSSPSVGYSSTFNNCTKVQTVVCPSATPPSISNDPFSNARAKSAITLKVPTFSVATYKLDSYWYQFGNIVECEEDPDFIDVDNANLMLTNNRRPTGKPSIRICRSGKLTIGGAAPMQISSFQFNCSATSTAAFLNTCPLVTADTAHAVFHMDAANKWYFMTPLYDVDLTRVAEHSDAMQFVFRQYNAANRASKGTGSSWQNVTDGVLHQGQGYIVQSNAIGWIHMPSINHSDTLIFRTEDVTVPLQTYASENVANESWNFIGNPYPAYYDIWYMDFTAPITVWTGSTYKAYSLADDNYALRPMEAFFVQKPAEVDNIIFHKEGRQVTTDISHSNTAGAPARRNVPQNTNRKVYNLSLMASDGMADETRVVINDAASLDYELTCDASKFMSMDANCPQLYTIDNNGNSLAINERPLADGMVSLGVQLPSTGEYTFAAVAAPDITLVDHQLGINHDLHAAPYTFISDMVEENTSRFSLLFGPRPVMTGLDNIDTQAGESGSYIYTLDGRVAGYISGTTDIHTLSLPTGIYMVRSGKTFTKVVIR